MNYEINFYVLIKQFYTINHYLKTESEYPYKQITFLIMCCYIKLFFLFFFKITLLEVAERMDDN